VLGLLQVVVILLQKAPSFMSPNVA